MRAYHVNGWWRGLAVAPLLSLLACNPATTPAPPQTEEPAPLPVPPAPPAKSQATKPRPPLDAAWSFEVSDGACRARASAGAAMVSLDVADDGTLVIDATPGADIAAYLRAARRQPPLLKVVAEGESWQWRLHATPAHQFEIRLAPSKAALAQSLLMLRGSSVTMSVTSAQEQTLHLAPAGSPGAAWFACAKTRMQSAAGDGS